MWKLVTFISNIPTWGGFGSWLRAILAAPVVILHAFIWYLAIIARVILEYLAFGGTWTNLTWEEIDTLRHPFRYIWSEIHGIWKYSRKDMESMSDEYLHQKMLDAEAEHLGHGTNF